MTRHQHSLIGPGVHPGLALKTVLKTATETSSMNNPRPSNHIIPSLRSSAFAAAALGLATLLAGCATGLSSGSGSTAVPASPTIHLTGQVFGGQQPVNGSTIQLYTVGVTGLKSASSPLLYNTNPVVTSDVNGSFSITGDYNCNATAPETAAGTQVYITATGGDPSPGVVNSNLTMMAALGSCATLLANANSTFIIINELTTVAAAYALAPFATDATHIGATGANPSGLVNAFTNAAVLVNTSTGTATGANLPAGVTVPVTELNTLGDIISACVNTASGSPSSSCSTVQTATSATDTFAQALAIAKNPGAAAIVALYQVPAGISAPFTPDYTTAPKDFSVAVNTTVAGNLSTPYAVAIDASGNAWVANEGSNKLVEVSPSGALSASSALAGYYGAQGVAVDPTGNIWLAATAANNVYKLTFTGAAVTASTSYNTTLSGPSAIAIDNQGNAWVANFNGASVTKLSNADALLATYTGTANDITVPSGIAIDTSGNVLVTSGASGSVIELSDAGAQINTLTDSALQGPLSLAIDTANANHVFVSGSTTSQTTVTGVVSEFQLNQGSTPSVAAASPVSSGLATPVADIATDGTSAWVANSVASGGLAQLAYGSATSTSPAGGFGTLNTPVGVAVDSSGSVWTANSGDNTLSKFIGLAAAVTTPIAVNVGH
jgi:streptogramin lyase